ncbi:MAG TPA: TPM domain-containing protein, partial [Candidatus Aminicenantes bacterium]|nr:TPM domain-containing protein [Candidatus Aminicenantes bacterium]
MKQISPGLRIIAAAGLGLALLFRPVPAAIEVDKVPNPLAAAHQWVGDNAGVLGPEYAALIHSACEALKAKTGAECAVITVDDLGGLSVEDFAARLFQRFGIGEAGKENGLLLLFSRDDRKIRLEVGYGLEEAIPDSLAGRILEEQALPFFREGRYGRGLYAAVRKTVETAAAAAGTT